MSAKASKPFSFPHDSMPGLPATDDPQVVKLTEYAATLRHEQLVWLMRGLYRSALGWQRTGNTDYLTMFADDHLVTHWLMATVPGLAGKIRNAPKEPPAPGTGVDVDEMLRGYGLLPGGAA